MTWYAKAWEWTKTNWMWLLFPIGIALYLVGRASGGTTTVVSPASLLVRDSIAKNDAAAEAAKVRAAEALAARLKEIEAKHAATLEVLTLAQEAKVEELRSDPEALNAFLLSVGKDIRG